TTRLYTLSLHDALPICPGDRQSSIRRRPGKGVSSAGGCSTGAHELAALFTRARVLSGKESTLEALESARGGVDVFHFAGHSVSRSEEHTSELQSPYDLV